MQSACTHKLSQVIARTDGVDYVRCQECGQVFEAEDLDTVPVYDDEE